MPLLAKPFPTEMTTPINLEGNKKMSVEAHRNLFCTAYDECLNEAVKRGWNSFTCVRCPNYTVTHVSPENSIEAFATQPKSAKILTRRLPSVEQKNPQPLRPGLALPSVHSP